MRFTAIPLFTIVAPLAAVIAISGCIDLPTDSDPIVIEGRTPAHTEGLRFLEASGTEPLAGVRLGTEPVAASFSVMGDEGTTLQLERFTLVVPAGAFESEAEICISIPDPELMICDLEIAPESANDFKVPLTLVADCKELVATDRIGELHILCFDEQMEKWGEVPDKSIHLQTMTVQTRIAHFSRHGVVMGRTDQ